MIDVRVQQASFDVGAELARLEALGGGAVASFTGVARDDDGLIELLIEHHPGMTGAALRGIADAAAARWPLIAIVLIHRYGALAPGARIVLVATAARHRAAALEACTFLIDWLKTDAPFWKRERFANGTTRWIEAKQDDGAAADRWRPRG